MEAEFDCGSSSNNGNDTPSSWIQATLSDLEENTKSMLSLIKPDDGRSFEECVVTYYKKKPELEKQIQQFQKLYHILLDQYAPILSRFSVSSISTANQPETKFDSNPQSHNIINSFDLAQLPDAKNATEINHKSLEENRSSDSIVELSVEEIDSEVEKNISKLSESGPKICGQNVYKHLVDFEKRVSTSEVILELAEDNKTHMNVLLKRYEEQNRMNKRLKENVEVLMRENQLLHDENVKLMSENKLLVSMIQDRVIMEGKKGDKSCSSCYGLRMVKNGFAWIKSCIMGACI